eukprot:1757577-Pleurochrysis_carterae.AAC.1
MRPITVATACVALVSGGGVGRGCASRGVRAGSGAARVGFNGWTVRVANAEPPLSTSIWRHISRASISPRTEQIATSVRVRSPAPMWETPVRCTAAAVALRACCASARCVLRGF